MAIRSFLFIIIATTLFSFKRGWPDYVNFLNVNPAETALQDQFAASQPIAYRRDSSKTFSIYDKALSRKEKVEDAATVNRIKQWITQFQYDSVLFQQNKPLSIYHIGEIKLQEHVLTKLFYIGAKDEMNSKELKMMIGLNIVKGQVVSIIELSRNLLLLGFSDATYSIWHKNKFKIVNPMASDVTGPGIKHARPDAYTVKMEDDGRLH